MGEVYRAAQPTWLFGYAETVHVSFGGPDNSGAFLRRDVYVYYESPIFRLCTIDGDRIFLRFGTATNTTEG